MFAKGMWPGFGNALMITGDQKYVDVLRRQMDNIYSQKKVVDGEIQVPNNYGVKGPKTQPPIFKTIDGKLYWEERETSEPGWYNWSSHRFVNELIDIYLWSMNRDDLEHVPMTGWIAFLEGKNPDYPEKALRGSCLSSGRRSRAFAAISPHPTPGWRTGRWGSIRPLPTS